jgi:phosphoribosyl-ATP pyrophosphohydrolase
MDTKIISDLVEIVKDRKENPSEKSYTTKLFTKGTNTLIKKLGEENAEFIQALLIQDDERVASEAADYIYHMIVAMENRDVDFEETLNILRRRFKK